MSVTYYPPGCKIYSHFIFNLWILFLTITLWSFIQSEKGAFNTCPLYHTKKGFLLVFTCSLCQILKSNLLECAHSKRHLTSICLFFVPHLERYFTCIFLFFCIPLERELLHYIHLFFVSNPCLCRPPLSGVEIRRTCRTIGHFLWMSDKKCWSAGPNVRQKL